MGARAQWTCKRKLGIHFGPLQVLHTSTSITNCNHSSKNVRRHLRIRHVLCFFFFFCDIVCFVCFVFLFLNPAARLLRAAVDHVYVPNVVLPGFNWRGGPRWLWDGRYCGIYPESTAELLLHHISLSRHKVIIIVAVPPLLNAQILSRDVHVFSLTDTTLHLSSTSI